MARKTGFYIISLTLSAAARNAAAAAAAISDALCVRPAAAHVSHLSRPVQNFCRLTNAMNDLGQGIRMWQLRQLYLLAGNMREICIYHKVQRGAF